MMVIDHENDLLLRSLHKETFQPFIKKEEMWDEPKKSFQKITDMKWRWRWWPPVKMWLWLPISLAVIRVCSTQSLLVSQFAVHCSQSIFLQKIYLPSTTNHELNQTVHIYFNIITKQMYVFFKRSVRRVKWTWEFFLARAVIRLPSYLKKGWAYMVVILLYLLLFFISG